MNLKTEGRWFFWLMVILGVLIVLLGTGSKFIIDYRDTYLHTVEAQEEASSFYDDNCLDRSKWAKWSKERKQYFHDFCDNDQHILAVDASESAFLTILSFFSIQELAQNVGDMSKVAQLFLLLFIASVLFVILLAFLITYKLGVFRKTHFLPLKDD